VSSKSSVAALLVVTSCSTKVSCLLIVPLSVLLQNDLFPCCAYSRQRSESDHSTHPAEYDDRVRDRDKIINIDEVSVRSVKEA